MAFDWDRELSVTLTIRQLYFLMKCSESVLTMGEVCDMMVGYEKLSEVEVVEIESALGAVVKVLKENK